MPLNLVRRGGGVLRSALARPVRVVPQSHIKRISFIARRPLLTTATAGFPRSSLLVGDLVRSYATHSTNKSSKGKKPTKAKKAVKKPAKRKRDLTEEQQAKLAEEKKRKQSRELLKSLKETALEPPKRLPTTVRALAVGKYIHETRKTTPTVSEAFKKASDLAQSMSASERQQYEDLAKANKAANDVALEAWLKTYTPRQILEANAARRRLAQITGAQRVNLIKDHRLVKRPRSSFMYFMKDKLEGRDTLGKSASELTKSLGEEWRSLSAADKTRYEQLNKDDLERYAREYQETYGSPPPYQVTERAEK
ncbi:hypothetical protein BJY01DRAFT_84108 [Aspergillus pseudoustus]|uniref:HMG box domain-containing protein n=1 Tax=Aspergillus pseudoustus TaxID=1810923 RepID=A0ABR4J3K8_9EURO